MFAFVMLGGEGSEGTSMPMILLRRLTSPCRNMFPFALGMCCLKVQKAIEQATSQVHPWAEGFISGQFCYQQTVRHPGWALQNLATILSQPMPD